jgi:hypothetical protein
MIFLPPADHGALCPRGCGANPSEGIRRSKPGHRPPYVEKAPITLTPADEEPRLRA